MAAFGLSGVAAFLASRHRREIGVLMALGARLIAVLLLMVRQAVWLIALGLATGTLLAAAVEKSMASGLRLLAVGTYLAVAAFLAAVALLAMLSPHCAPGWINLGNCPPRGPLRSTPPS